MSIRIPPIARGNLRKIQRGQEVKSDILHATLHGLICTIKTAQRKKAPPLPPPAPALTPDCFQVSGETVRYLVSEIVSQKCVSK